MPTLWMTIRGIDWRGQLVNRQHTPCGFSCVTKEMHVAPVLDLQGTHCCLVVLLASHAASTFSYNSTDVSWRMDLSCVSRMSQVGLAGPVLALHGTHGCVMILLTMHTTSTCNCNLTEVSWIIELHLVIASGLRDAMFNDMPWHSCST